ncbi:hypothetical protein SDC9_175089 [bioreactor metagenome]|uniref:Uncharacterized protein n=1 Tax=bioreactor metagenome TaxID=1076179 RepID=A0A645GLQ6_9ZZZZ
MGLVPALLHLSPVEGRNEARGNSCPHHHQDDHGDGLSDFVGFGRFTDPKEPAEQDIADKSEHFRKC